MSESTTRIDGGALALQDLLRHNNWVRGFCRSLVGAEEGDDLAQETWLVALRKPAESIKDPRSWLASVSRRIARDRGRSSARRKHREDLSVRADASGDESTADLVQRSELAHVVAGEVFELKEPYRTAVLLRYFEGLDATAIGTRLGVPATTVRSRIQRGLASVREALDRRHGGDRSRWMSALVPLAALPKEARAGWLVPMGVAATALVAVGWAVLRTDPVEPARKPLKPVGERAALAGVPQAVRQDDGEGRRRVQVEPVADAGDARALVAPRIAWHFPMSQHAPPLVLGDRLLSVSRDITCLAADDGRVLWNARGASSGPSWVGPPIHVGGRIVVAHRSGAVACFDFESGRQLWLRSFEEVLGSGMPCALARSSQGKALCLLGTTGGIVALGVEDGSIQWRAELDGKVMMRPAVGGGRALCGTESGSFYALDLDVGTTVWKHESGAKFGWTNPVVQDGVCYVGDRGGSGDKYSGTAESKRRGAVNAFDVETGECLWSEVFGATGFSEPFVDAKYVWAGFGSRCGAFDKETGAFLEERSVRTGHNAFGSPRVLGPQLVFGNLDGHLYAHDVESGELLWKFAPRVDGERTQVGGWTAAHGRIYLATNAGIFALEDAPGASPVEPGTLIVAGPEELVSLESIAAVLEASGDAVAFENADTLAATWADAILPRDDDGEVLEDEVDSVAKSAALEEVEAGLTSANPTRVRAALLAIARCEGAAGFGPLREVVRSYARDGQPAMRVTALAALFAIGPAEGSQRRDDLGLVHAAWEVVDATDQLRIPTLCRQFDEGNISGRSAEIVLELLSTPERGPLRQWINGLWGARVSEEVSDRLIELATDPKFEAYAYDSFYYALSTLAHKSPAVLEVLVASIDRPRVSSRAAWGLTHGVPEESRAYVVGLLLDRWPDLDEQRQAKVRQLVERYGSEADLAGIGG